MRDFIRRELTGIALLLVAVFLGGALLLQPLPEGVSCADVRGFFGPVGACLKFALWTSIGVLGASLIPLAAAVHALRLFGRLQSSTDRSWLVFLFGAAAVVPVAAGLATGAIEGEAPAVAGVWGNFVAYYLTRGFGVVGAWIAVALAGSALMAITLRWNPIRMLVAPSPPRAAGTAPAASLASQLEPAPEELPAIEQGAIPAEGKRAGEGRSRKRAAAPIVEDQGTLELHFPLGDVLADELPSPELLTAILSVNVESEQRELDQMGQKLMDALRTFKVDGELLGRTTGPVVTQYEIEPAAGVKVRQFANLANDLALAMRAASIRIVAPIPGRGAVVWKCRTRTRPSSPFGR